MKAWLLVLLAPCWLAAGPLRPTPTPTPTPNMLRKPGETVVFSFVTKRGKTVMLCEGPKSTYLVYRFGTPAKVELQYPAVPDASSWHKFTYYAAQLGAGTSGVAREIYQLTFMNGNTLYSIDDETDTSLTKKHEYSYRREVSVSVTVNDKTLTISGDAETAVGDLRLEDDRLKREPDGEGP